MKRKSLGLALSVWSPQAVSHNPYLRRPFSNSRVRAASICAAQAGLSEAGR